VGVLVIVVLLLDWEAAAHILVDDRTASEGVVAVVASEPRGRRRPRPDLQLRQAIGMCVRVAWDRYYLICG